jgi:hypothetical protein
MKIRGEIRLITAVPEPTNEDGLLIDDAPGRSESQPRRTFSPDWREPKLMTLFIHNEHGKMVKQTKATIDGTQLGPDAIGEVVAMHLHRLGATESILQVRCQVVPDQWDLGMSNLAEFRRTEAYTDLGLKP